MNGSFSKWLLSLVLVAPLAFAESIAPPLTVVLDRENPAQSEGRVGSHRFQVGYGRDGFSPEGSRFQGGVSLLGEFRVNAILAVDRFEMTQELVERSGKSKDWLRKNLFKNMSAIDFDGDGAAGEYGAGFISLEPIDGSEQPFRFSKYNGVFRWYSYALHGTQNESRIGKKITGGCINVGTDDLARLLETVKLGDVIHVRAAR